MSLQRGGDDSGGPQSQCVTKSQECFFCIRLTFMFRTLPGAPVFKSPLLELPNADWNLVPLKGTDRKNIAKFYFIDNIISLSLNLRFVEA